MVDFELGKEIKEDGLSRVGTKKNKLSFSISSPSSKLTIFLPLFTKHDAIDIADPSSM